MLIIKSPKNENILETLENLHYWAENKILLKVFFAYFFFYLRDPSAFPSATLRAKG
jgi:hypothetical protein